VPHSHHGASLTLGDSKLEVIAKCGEPAVGGFGVDPSVGQRPDDRRASLLARDEWKYDFGRERHVHYLSFRYGRLLEIRTGGFGS
jgi:hypothetical protein